MADAAAITAVINKTVDIGANLIIKIGTRLQELPENIKWIESKMRHFQSCLKDAEMKEPRSHELANLINDMRDLALDIEDVLDTYLPEMVSHKHNRQFQLVKHASCLLCYGAKANNFAVEIEKFKKQAKELEDKYGVSTIDTDSGCSPHDATWNERKKFLIAKEQIIVGRGNILNKLKEKVVSKNCECKMICVVGEGGVGKTTVVKKLYRQVKNEFACSAMVYVSQEPRVKELLLEIATQVGLKKEEIEEKLEENLQSLLEKKSCLILLDDIWQTRTWDALKIIMPTNSKNGSRIIITSRKIDVGRYIGDGDVSSLTHLKPLSDEQSWDLFSKSITPSSSSSLENNNQGDRFDIRRFEDIGRKIVNKCAGLPLAIVVAAGMLKMRNIRSRVPWEQVHDNMSSTSDQNGCLPILSLSYKDLPLDLRPLFLYFGLFPEDKEIFVDELVGAWAAEKLILVDQTKNLNHVVAEKLEMLYDRNLIQVSHRSLDDRIQSCRIHDVLRSLCIEKATESNFFSTTFQNVDTHFLSRLRRLTIDKSNIAQYVSNFTTPKLRTMLCVSSEDCLSLPEELGNFLSYLTYLKMVGNFNGMPSSIWNLKKLQTLDIQEAKFAVKVSFPTSILKMRYLKHILLPKEGHNIHWPSMGFAAKYLYNEACCLPSLETLGWIFGLRLESSLLSKFSNLRKLKLRLFTKQHVDIISRTKPVLDRLQELELNIPDKEWGNRWNLSGYKYLVKLDVYLSVHEKILDRFEFPPNLIELSLRHLTFEDDPMKILKKLSKLEILELNDCRYISNFPLDISGANSFPQLQVLVIIGYGFSELIVNEMMPNLYKFDCNFGKLLRSSSEECHALASPRIPESLRKIMVGETSIAQEELT